jgi:cytidylate kinase
MAKKINVAVDGTAGSGKSFIFKKVADLVDYQLIDTGLMYRAFTYFIFSQKINFADQQAIVAALPSFQFSIENDRVLLNNN